MCYHKAGELELVDGRAIARMLDGDDRHTEIRAAHKIPEAGSAGDLLARLHTPVEFRPVRGCEQIEDFDLVWDADRPDWVTYEMSADICKQMFTAAQRDRLATTRSAPLCVIGKLTLPVCTKVGNVWAERGSTINLPVCAEMGDVKAYGGSTIRIPRDCKVKGKIIGKVVRI